MSQQLDKTQKIARELSLKLHSVPADKVQEHFREQINQVPEEYRELVEHIVAATIIYGMRTDPRTDGMSNTDKTLLWIGVSFLIASLGLAIFIPQPSVFQLFVFRTFVALAAGAFAAFIPGMLHVKIGTVARGGGALAVFLLVYAVNPAAMIL